MRLAVIAALLAVPAAARASGEGVLGPIVLADREPLAFLLSTPTGEMANTSSSDLIRIVSTYADKHTNFFLQVLEPQVATDCRGRLGCLVQQLRAPYPKFMLVMSNVTLAGEADRLSAVLVDVGVALDYSNAATADGDQDAEARINEYAVALGPERAQVKDTAETESFVRTLFEQHLIRVFKESDNWEPFGAIDLGGAGEGVAITLDGAAIGVTRPGTTKIVNVTAGPRKLTLEHPAFEPYTADVEVTRGQTAAVEVSMARRVSGGTRTFRTALFWAGVAAAVSGAAVTTIALAQHDGDLAPTCLQAPGTSCRTGGSFQSFAYDPEAMPGSEINGSGVYVAPLGLAFLGTGAAWSLGTALIGEEGDLPWIQLAAGVVAGGLVYGLGSAMSASP